LLAQPLPYTELKVLSLCITAKRGITTNGYSRIRIGNKQIQAHRWAWELINGAIPDGKVIDHLCKNKACIAPDHLRVVSQQENIMAGLHNIDNRTHCNQGHIFEGNIMVRKNGKRECGECNRARSRANWAKKVKA
jgi:hypothetical protein